MTLSTIAQSFVPCSTLTVYEYSFDLKNSVDGDIQENLIAAFIQPPNLTDWKNWLSGWNSCGYSLVAEPQLIRTI